VAQSGICPGRETSLDITAIAAGNYLIVAGHGTLVAAGRFVKL
jgi:hypothetical protein